jgi:hypothetical protein
MERITIPSLLNKKQAKHPFETKDQDMTLITGSCLEYKCVKQPPKKCQDYMIEKLFQIL